MAVDDSTRAMHELNRTLKSLGDVMKRLERTISESNRIEAEKVRDQRAMYGGAIKEVKHEVPEEGG